MPMTPPPVPYSLASLVTIMADLRDPVNGCPWDRQQDFSSIAPYTIEEAHEVADAISRGDMADLRGELGDLLLQVVYHSRMAEEAGAFTIADVITDICAKMVRRHPHVYGNAADPGIEGQPAHWEAIKAAERDNQGRKGALEGVALGLPALLRATKLQKRASRVGFDWPDAAGPRAKIDEELAECAAAQDDPSALHDEMGDLLFSVVNWARHLAIDPEGALRDANAKFESRFKMIEDMATKPLKNMTIDELELLWQQAKSIRRTADSLQSG